MPLFRVLFPKKNSVFLCLCGILEVSPRPLVSQQALLPAPFLLSVSVRAKLAPLSYDFRLPLELDLDCGVHDWLFAESVEGCAEVVGGWWEGFDLGGWEGSSEEYLLH